MNATRAPGAASRTVDLELSDVDRLIAQLRAGTDSLKLHDLVGTRYPHAHALHSYFLANLGQRVKWAACLDILIAANAPVDDRDMSTGSWFARSRWFPAPELTNILAEAYMATGFITPDEPLPCRRAALASPASTQAIRERGYERSPLCCAIEYVNIDCVNFLLEHGASLNFRSDALVHAHEIGCGPVIASLAAATMRRQIGGAAGPAPEAKRRRRMAV